MSENKTKITAEAGKQEIFIEREFDAPRELVFKAFTEPDIFARWMGPRKMEMVLERFEAVDGGSWRYTHSDGAGNAYRFRGVFHEVVPPERIIQTFEFEGLPEKGHVTLETARFEATADGRTKVTMQSVFQSVADRDGMMQSGMESGVNESFERLDDYLQQTETARHH